MELDATTTTLPIQILGVNGPPFGSGNAAMCQDRDCPWLQPTEDNDPQPLWGTGYRDVVILDAQNRLIEAFNLTTHDLRIAAEYEDLKTRLLAAANP